MSDKDPNRFEDVGVINEAPDKDIDGQPRRRSQRTKSKASNDEALDEGGSPNFARDGNDTSLLIQPMKLDEKPQSEAGFRLSDRSASQL